MKGLSIRCFRQESSRSAIDDSLSETYGIAIYPSLRLYLAMQTG